MIIKLDNRNIEIRDDQAKAYEKALITSVQDMARSFVNAYTTQGYKKAIVECTDEELIAAILSGMRDEMEMCGCELPLA